jgi:hypothetical protein
MWSKLLILAMVAVFLTAVAAPVMATDGRIGNIIADPNDGDEHPWGGDHEAIDPTPALSADQWPLIYSGQSFFIKLSVSHYWMSVRQLFWEITVDTQPATGETTGTTTTSMPINNDPAITNQGARNQ